MEKEEFITERTRIISEMLDNPENGIYQTSKCFEALDLLFDKITKQDKGTDFKARLIKDRMQLEEKVEKLNEFLKGAKSNEIDQIQLALLGIQLPAMKTYLRCLNERIGRL